MSDQDQSPEKVVESQPAPVEVVPAEPSAELQSTGLQSTETTAAEGIPEHKPEHKAHRAPRDMFGAQAFLTVVIFSIFVITFIVQAFQIPSGSMENTLLIGDFLLVDKLHFAGRPGASHLLPYGTIKRGDIVVFYFWTHHNFW